MASQSSLVQLTPDSPVRFKSVHSDISYRSGPLEDARQAVLRDLGSSIPQIPLETFLKYLAPTQPNFDLKKTMRSLKVGSERALTSSNRWLGFPNAPKEASDKENVVYRPMTEIFMKVVIAIIANSGGSLDQESRTVDFLQDPNRAPLSVGIYNESKPDGYMVLKNRNTAGESERIHWAHIALSCEYKRSNAEKMLDDDVLKIVWNLQQAMRDDTRRRASFGITIENFTTRVWFCCRSSVVVSKPFDFMKEPENLVKLFAAFAFANEQSLGFDPTIQPVLGRNGQFIVTIHPDNDKRNFRRFETTKLLSSYGAEPLRGRGTRVFEAVEIDRNGTRIGPHMVLKDIWIDNDRIREGNILALLHATADDDDDRRLVERHFLTTICHGDVWTDLGILDDTANALMRGLDVKNGHKSFFKLQRTPFMPNKNAPSGSGGRGGATPAQSPRSYISYAHKTHYRIVFKENGITLDRVKSLPDVMTVLTETVSALRLLRKLGWVHRDVSIGNILSCGGHAKLADLEYAKKMGDSGSHETRTGTLNFMPIEVAAQGFLFLPSGGEFSLTDFDAYVVETEQGGGPAPKAIPFSYNHLHDLESLWWIAVWVVFFNHFSEGTSSPDRPSLTMEDASRQLKLAQTLFPLELDPGTRRDVIQKNESFLKKYERLPPNRKAICVLLDGLRKLLTSNYKIVEAKHPLSVNPDSLNNEIYDGFTKGFSITKTRSHGVVLDFIPDMYEKLSKVESSKRSRSDSTHDIGSSQKSQKI